MKVLLLCAAVPIFAIPASGQAIPFVVTVDEHGNEVVNGTLTTGHGTTADPGPGGLSSVLTYPLPFAGVQGDVTLTATEGPFDVVRFNGDSTLLFYSDDVGGVDALGDTPTPPGGDVNRTLYANQVSIAELGTETLNGATYTPTAGQPGFNSQDLLHPTTYNLISDGAVPEPSSLALTGTGLLGFAALYHRRRMDLKPERRA